MIAQLGERQTEDLKVAGSNPAQGNFDIMAEWLRRWTANPLGSARAGSNPADVAFLSLMVQWLGFVSFTHAARVRFPVRE